MKVVVALVMLGALFAGCSSKGSSDDGTNEAAASGESAETLAVPTWQLRDYWTYQIGDSTATYVVTEDKGSDWFVDTDNPDRAWQNARDDVSRLGNQRKSDLAGSQDPERVEFFRWPLADNLTWSASWDHVPVTITAQVDGSQATLEAYTLNGTLDYRYVYDAEVGWFRELTHFAPDGSEIITLRLTASGHNWTGNVVRWTYETIQDKEGDLSGGIHDAVNFDVPLTVTDVWVRFDFSCTQGTALGGVAPMPIAPTVAGTDPRGTGLDGTTCPFESTFMGSIGAPKAPPQGGDAESWGYSLIAGPDTGSYKVVILIRTMETRPIA